MFLFYIHTPSISWSVTLHYLNFPSPSPRWQSIFWLSDICFPLQLHLSALKFFSVIINLFFSFSSLKYLLSFQRMYFFALTWLYWNELFLSYITTARAQKGVQIQVAVCFECVYGESWGKIWSQVPLKWCWNIAMSAHSGITSWHTVGAHSTRPGPFTTVLLLAPSSQWPEPGGMQGSNLFYNYSDCSHFFARPLMHTCLVIVQNIHQTIHQSNDARIPQLSFWKPSHLRSLCTTWAPASPFMSHKRKMSRHISSKKSDSDSSWTCSNTAAGLV